jgi:hypothetical protein
MWAHVIKPTQGKYGRSASARTPKYEMPMYRKTGVKRGELPLDEGVKGSRNAFSGAGVENKDMFMFRIKQNIKPHGFVYAATKTNWKRTKTSLLRKFYSIKLGKA